MLQRFGDYKVTRSLVADEHSEVVEAESIFGQAVIIQSVPISGGEEDYGVRQRFRRDTQRLIELDHQGVMAMIDAGETDDRIYVVLEPLKGLQLTSIVNTGSLDLSSVTSIGMEIGDTLVHLHELGIVAGDIQPSNVLVNAEGRAVLSGLAMSVLIHAGSGKRNATALGRPGFVAPEVVDGGENTPLSDQYALGRLLIYLATGNQVLPIDQHEPIERQLHRGLLLDWSRFPRGESGDELRHVVERMAAREPAERFESMSTCLAELIRLAQRLPPAQRIDTSSPPEPAAIAGSASVLRSIDASSFPQFEVSHVSSVPGAKKPGSDSDDLWLSTDTDQLIERIRSQAKRHLASPAAIGDGEEPSAPRKSHLIGDLEAEFAADEHNDPTEPTPAITRDPKSLTMPLDAVSWSDVEGAEDPTVGVQSAVLRRGLLEQRAAPRPASEPPDEPITEQFVSRPSRAPSAVVEFSDDEETSPPDGPLPPAPPAPEPEPEFRKASTIPTEGARRAGLTRNLAIGLAAVSLLVGMTIAFAFGVGGGEPMPEQVAPIPPEDRAVALFTYEGRGEPEPQQEAVAVGLLSEARGHAAERRFDDAERLLGLCIRMADLPECHRALAGLLSLTGKKGARAHLSKYLEQRPDGPDHERLSALLE